MKTALFRNVAHALEIEYQWRALQYTMNKPLPSPNDWKRQHDQPCKFSVTW